MIPRATYRLQFHSDFTFADAREIVAYLAQLGISHVYASPLTEARQGSTHGYDVTDPTRISEILGGEDGLKSLVADLREQGMGLILDIVPNHMAASPENPWWADLLKHGQDSRFASFFDVDWSRHEGRMLLPVLGDPLEDVIEQGQVEIVERDGEPALLLYGEQTYPLAPGTAEGADLRAILDAQHYRLAWWRVGHDELNWRRFFSISELAGLRMEDDAAFEAVHELPLRLYRQGVVDGLRIDHVDGLSDPAAYLSKLRARLAELDRQRGDGPAWLVVEKILGPGEDLPKDWPVDGTTGYEFMDQVSLLLHDPAGEADLTKHWARLSGRPALFEKEERAARRQMLGWQFTGQFEACVDALAELAARTPETARFTRAAWARAVEALLLVFPVYRTYGTGTGAPESDRRIRSQVAEQLPEVCAPGETELAERILDWLAGNGPAAEHSTEFVRRFQQLSAPIAAKAVEDTAFYRYGRLISRNNVGFDAHEFSFPPVRFHELQAERAQNWPNSMLTTATHDHKRGEDVRARLAAISAGADEWVKLSRDWMDATPGATNIDPAELYMLLQVVVGAWPDGVAPRDGDTLSLYCERLKDFAVKALREAKLRSSWVAPDERYEAAVGEVIEALLTSGAGRQVREDLCAYLERIAPEERVKRVAQVFLRNTCPGIPDCYQGTELADRSLVDPDNRRPVDYRLREQLLRKRADEKQLLIRDLLHLRRRFPDAFNGAYEPLEPTGEHARDLIAFTRGEGESRLLMVAALGRRSGTASLWSAAQGEDAKPPILSSAGLSGVAGNGENLLALGFPCGVWLAS